MKPLKLPDFREPGPPPPILSMEEYYRFVQFSVRYLVDPQQEEARRAREAVNVPFVLKKIQRSS